MIISHTYKTILQEKAGVLVVDKPTGVSSHTLVNWARKAFSVRKIGHTGTLDPLASGLLVLLVGREYTKQQERFLKLDKGYTVTGKLGVETDTYDSAGRIVTQSNWEVVQELADEDIIEAVMSFQGEIEQTVPAFSAVKRGGKKLYELALTGEIEKVSLPTRTVQILSISDVSVTRDSKNEELFFTCTVFCSSGTYIRSLIHDIGAVLEVGAHVTQLRRIQIGDCPIQQAKLCPFLPRRFFFTN